MHNQERGHSGTPSPVTWEVAEAAARSSDLGARKGSTDRELNRNFARLYEDLRRIVGQVVHDPDLAADITAITFERAYSTWLKGKSAALTLAYMKAAAANVRRDLARTERREATRRTQLRAENHPVPVLKLRDLGPG